MSFQWTDEHTKKLIDQPHLLGHVAGKVKLSQIHSDWIKYIWRTTDHRSLQGHRGSYKTTAVSVIGSIWWLLFHPSERIAICRKTYSDAAECLATIKKMMTMPEMQSIFHAIQGFPPKMTTKRDGSLTFNFKREITPEGSIDAYGLDTSIVGKHYDRIVCDDIITIDDRLSKAARERTIEFVREVRTNIVDPGKPCSFIGTPWHTRDAWLNCPTPIKYPISATTILTPEEIDEKRKTTTPVLFAANYLLEHQSDDMALFKDPVYTSWEYTAKEVVCQLDAAFDGNHFCTLTFMAQRVDGTIQAVGYAYPGNVKDWIPRICALYKQYRAKKIYNEVNPDKGYTADLLKANGLNVREYQEKQNKSNKISTYLYKWWPKIQWATETDVEYMEQVVDWRDGQEPDDAPDSASSLLREHFETKAGDDILWQA